MKVYRTWNWSDEIDEIEADRMEGKSVWIRGRRQNVSSRCDAFWRTRAEAVSHIRQRLQDNISELEQEYRELPARISRAKEKLQEFEKEIK